MKYQDRKQLVRTRLTALAKTRGAAYTAGLLIGIISRLSRTDSEILKEILVRTEDLAKKKD
jgi:hypothetical protein